VKLTVFVKYLDLLGSRDVIGHVTIWYPSSRVLYVFHLTECVSPAVTWCLREWTDVRAIQCVSQISPWGLLTFPQTIGNFY